MFRVFTWLSLFSFLFANAQSDWPSEGWSGAANLTALMDENGITDLSGLHWNPATNRLYCVQGDGRLRVLQLETAANTFSQIANKVVPDGPEGITQVNFLANEFYAIDENNYEIRKFTHNANFSNMVEAKHWDLLASPSPMEDTGNTGPEGIVFIPDTALTQAGFISQVTGSAYTSVKGMGGLMFVAHQDGGYIWVFDINPNTTNDFAYVGKYKTNREESCDLAFDRTTGMLYILHNENTNRLEVTNLQTAMADGERKFITASEYNMAIPDTDGNINIEGFAISPKCPMDTTVSVWLCRDVESNEDDEILQDALRWFSPFASEGDCESLSNPEFAENDMLVFPNPGINRITVAAGNIQNATLQITNTLGQVVMAKSNINGNNLSVDVSGLQSGIYVIAISDGQKTAKTKWLKE